jgi:erythromycin esterase
VRPAGLAIGLLCVLASASVPAREPVSPDSQVAAWIAANALPLDERGAPAAFSVLERRVAGAEVVAFGEANHNAREFLEFRNQLFRFLVEEEGFTAIAAETDFVQSIRADDYVRGAAGIEAAAATHAVLSWTRAAFEENRELLDWMRSHNARQLPGHELRFYGLEAGGNLEHDGREILRYVFGYLRAADPQTAREFEQRSREWRESLTLAAYGQLSAELRDRVLVDVQDLVSRFERWRVIWRERTSPLDYERAHRAAITARQLVSSLRIGGDGRDIAAFENLRWALEAQRPRGRLFLFMHNMHVTRWRKYAPPQHPLHSSVGEQAAGLLGGRLVVIGSSHEGGTTRHWLDLPGFDSCQRVLDPAAPGSLDAMLATAPEPAFLLELRGMPTAVSAWFARERRIRNVNIPDGYSILRPAAAFDALVFFREITPLRPTQAVDFCPVPQGTARP